MKRLRLILMVGCLLGWITPATVVAAKADGKKAKLIAKYDKNGNGVIDGDESAEFRKDFQADTKGDLKDYDKDGDGVLSDEEIQSIKPGANKKSKSSGNSGKPKGEKKQGGDRSEGPQKSKPENDSEESGDQDASKTVE